MSEKESLKKNEQLFLLFLGNLTLHQRKQAIKQLFNNNDNGLSFLSDNSKLLEYLI